MLRVEQLQMTHRQAVLTCAVAAVIAVMCAALLTAAALVPAPPGVLPLIAAVCVVLPMLAAWQSASSLEVLRVRWPRHRLDREALVELRRELDRLPETGHPLDL
jgi:hypothetical protein